MKNIIGMLCLILCGYTAYASSPEYQLSGTIREQKNGKALPGVSVYFPEWKTGTISDEAGRYHLHHLPGKGAIVQVTLLGFQTYTEWIDLGKDSIKDFSLAEAVREMHDVVITGLSKSAERNHTPLPVLSVSHTTLMQEASTNIIDALAQQASIAQVTTGAGISKPVIRGLGYNRVVVVQDGVRQEGQQWGDEHGIETDENQVYQVEILKGPASLAYGSDALAGVIHFLSYPSLPEGRVEGSLLLNGQSNNGLLAGSFNLQGCNKGWQWDIRTGAKEAHAYSNKQDGWVYHSGFREQTFEAKMGVNRSWGYTRISFSHYRIEPQMSEGLRDPNGHFLKSIRVNDTLSKEVPATTADAIRYRSDVTYQQVDHDKVVWDQQLNIGRGNLKWTIAWQQNHRQEFDDILHPAQAGLALRLQTLPYHLQYELPLAGSWKCITGVSGMMQVSKNEGTEFLIPDYHLLDVGAFVMTHHAAGTWDISGGLRMDARYEKGDALWLDTNGQRVYQSGPGIQTPFASFSRRFDGLSGSIGCSKQLNKHSVLKMNLARGFRAPNIAELSANGIHEGSYRYETGDRHLQLETATEADFSCSWQNEHLHTEADVFVNDVTHYVYQHAVLNAQGMDSAVNEYPLFHAVQGHAVLRGGEWTCDWHPHPLDWLHWQNSFSYVRATQTGVPDSMRNLPLIPPAKWRTELRMVLKSWMKGTGRNAYLKVEMEKYVAQNKFYAAYHTETATAGYWLFHAGAGSDIYLHKRKTASLFLQVNNIGNTAYISHLSRLKYEGYNPLTGKTGIYNMGRTVSLKVLIPFVCKS